MTQNMNGYTATDFWVWKTLFTRQTEQLQKIACAEYLNCLDLMKPVLNPDEIPNFGKINNWFKASTDWQIEVVSGLIPVEDFFELLSRKKFCSSTWLRGPESLDYLEEPDMFHDVFGHVPLLANEEFSNFAHAFGILGVQLKDDQEAVLALQRLYWYTIEFGLINQNGLKIYGAGIISSFGETNRSISSEVEHSAFDAMQVIKKEFRTDVMQDEYVVIDSIKQLNDSVDFIKQHLNNLVKI